MKLVVNKNTALHCCNLWSASDGDIKNKKIKKKIDKNGDKYSSHPIKEWVIVPHCLRECVVCSITYSTIP